ncbi:Pfam:TUG [Seminavis robusta]|uniref:Pfam:TUG n=1 Tax=Seminavis robusta TaxID=568900 RepID=A0A9N8DQR5_9STRA|nr:Pfam:TUG [Seminavis robusta]|eukprot:Sro190_g081770.1 Pfam:TUG (487) ;mRNA; f:27457-28917
MEVEPSPSSSYPHHLSVQALDQAVDLILKNNFDVDTKACFITLMKVLDNVIQKPFDPKVRSIRLGNPAFSKKVSSRKGGVEFLLACGFVQETPPPPLLSKEAPEAFLFLRDDDGDNATVDPTTLKTKKEAYTSHIITARRLLLTRAIQDLHLKAEELPTYRPPPPPVATHNTASTTTTSANKRDASATFNPFQPQRHDAMSAAVGAQLTPDGNYVSTTEKQLQNLQNKQKKLESKLHKEIMNREWVGSRPNASGKPTAIIAAANSSPPDDDNKGNGSLIAAQFAKQQAAQKQREQGGFTTKSMRELERLKKQKVYSHTQIALQFSDGTIVQGKFLPKEKIQTVMTALQQDCFLEPSGGTMELYVTPPRKTLDPKATLDAEGLVPAAKVFVKCASMPSLKPELFTTTAATAFPSSQPIVHNGKANEDKGEMKPAAAAAKPKSAEDKEEEMMRRMLGGGRRLGGGGGAKNSSDGSKPKSGGMPKWFKK